MKTTIVNCETIGNNNRARLTVSTYEHEGIINNYENCEAELIESETWEFEFDKDMMIPMDDEIEAEVVEFSSIGLGEKIIIK